MDQRTVVGLAEDPGNEAAHKRPGNAQQPGHEQPEVLRPGHDETRNGPDDDTDNEHPDEVKHGNSSKVKRPLKHGSPLHRVTFFTQSAGLRALLCLLLGSVAPLARALPSYEEVKQAHRSSDTLVLDRHGEVVQRLRTDTTVRRGAWVSLGDMSPALRSAMLLSEDKRFYEHSGVDWRAVSAAAWGNLWHQRTRGASTITMQLAGLLDETWRAGGQGRTVTQKLGQTVAAQVLERRWRKDQILEGYVNLVPFRGELVGIDALSRVMFGKAAHGLDEREAAVAVALVRAPNAKPAALVNRACGVQRLMQAALGGNPGPGDATCLGLDVFVDAALQRRALDHSEGWAPHAARRLLAEATASSPSALPPQRLTSTLSLPLQRVAVHSLQRHLRALQGRQVEDGALVVLDNASGEVLAWVGSSGALSQASEVDAVLAPRQAGSTLKPFLYAQALAEKRLTAASLLEDAPTHIPTANGLYIPQNYDRQFKGWVSVRTALASSLNVPAVRTLVMVSPDAMQRQLALAGLALRHPGEHYGHSLALGSAEVSLLALTNAYRTLANGGQHSATRLQLRTAGPPVRFQAALDPRAAFIVSDILSDTNARARTFGTDSVLATRFWTAVKTGTSKDMRDNWAVGYSQRYTVGVWVGNASGAAMHAVSGTTGAAPIWAEVMQHLHRDRRSQAPAAPAGVVHTPVHFGQQIEAPRQEWFLAGTQQSLFAVHEATEADASLAKITRPVPGTILALDPDIPPLGQRVQLRSRGSSSQVQWSVDGKPLGRGPTAQWAPWPGKHVVRLTDARGGVLDEVSVEVRGAGVRR